MLRRIMSFGAGVLAMLLAAMLAVCIPAVNEQQFVRALKETVRKEALGVTDEQLASFGTETIRYLRGQQDVWQPQIPAQGIAQSFRDHMAQVRGWVLAVPWLAAAALIVCLTAIGIGRDRRAFLRGMAAPLCVTALILLWALIDFESLWMMIHRVFIPGGIFPAGEAVMQLFPLALFFTYIPGVLGLLVLFAAPVAAYAAFPYIAKGQRT